jgi:hypothetical protein
MTIGEFLLKLACDSAFLSRFSDDREGLMREAGLGERQIEFLRVADLRELRVKINAELVVGDEKLYIHTVCVPTICIPPPPPPTQD